MIAKDNNAGHVLRTYEDYERQITLNHLKVGCYLVMMLMPVGVVLDYCVYPAKVRYFLELRLLSAALAFGIRCILHTRLSARFHKVLSLIIALIPSFFICWMICDTEGIDSPYYAGLNLVLLCIALIMRWTVDLSVMASVATIGMYLAACLLHGPIHREQFGDFVNNFYFLVLTSCVVIIGGHLHRSLRIREFSLRYELDKSRQALEASLHQLKENEIQLVQSEKLASLGRMSAGIIHEINNPLNFATTGLYTLRSKAKHLAPEYRAEYQEILTDVEEGVHRVKTIVSDLRTFSHPDAGHGDEVQVSDVVAASLRFLSNEFKDAVQLETRIPADQTVWANKNKLIHVLVNLLQNSLDAVKSKKYTDEKPCIEITGAVENGRSSLSVRDNGPGIESNNVDKIFDPFFTTKDVGAGMGLGLSICHRIVQEYSGKILVKTEPGKFCEFTLEFAEKG